MEEGVSGYLRKLTPCMSDKIPGTEADAEAKEG